MGEVVRYVYRLRPGRRAEAALLAEWGRCRWLWNEAVHQQKSGNKPTLAKLGKLLTGARAKMPWLREGSQVAQQQMLRDYSRALDQSFTVKGRGRPVVKSRKKTLPSLEYTTRGFGISSQGRLTLPKGVTIPVVWSRELPAPPTSVRVYRDSLGHWYASFVVRREVLDYPCSAGGVGIDWGVSVTATASDLAFDLRYQGHRKRCAAELARAQRKMSRRRRKGRSHSRGYIEAKRQAAKLAKKAARQTAHDSRVWAKRVVDAHALIAIEDFKPVFLAKSSMARKAADAAIGAAKRAVIERAGRAGRRVVLVRPAYTTMTCSCCFARAKRLDLHERNFHCDGCGYTDCRDRNAAKVVLAVAERGHTSVDDMRQAGHLRRECGLVAV
ncbi:RNA-guided endonuclease InsQ/TnpB family protein [Nocardia rhamnosiphila]|uniref:RNA-guided endonuclease InsQ/TnpB family protein n=1 Tax=Nocardia rhamnosiphila TaxID=426716 RepID=UPI0004C42B09|nr:RNA-guided endonuclease TnpB family protein [Nocardia rhamnosiphila]